MSDPIAHGYDWAWADIRGANIKAGSGTFAVRYLGGSASLTDAEAAELHAAGIAILLVFEQEATLAEGGFARGVSAAQAANAQADQLGYPADCVIFYADDNNDAETGSEVEFMRGVLSVGGRPAGIYSGGNVCAAVKAAFPQVYTWRVETWFPQDYPNPDLEQLANTRDPAIPGVDADSYDTDLLFDHIPMWGPHGTINGEEVTEAQMQQLGDWMKQQSLAVIAAVKAFMGQWEQDTRGQINAHTDAQVTAALTKVSGWFGQLQDHIDALPTDGSGKVDLDAVRGAVADVINATHLEVTK